MEIDKDVAEGVKVETDEYEIVVAKRKDTKDNPVSDNIIGEIWFRKK